MNSSQKELKYNISENAKTSVITTVNFLNDEIASLRDILKEWIKSVAPTISIWFVDIWISKTMFIHHMI
jgi:hypothetical protein